MPGSARYSGEQSAWNARRESRGHQAIPLPSVAAVKQAAAIGNPFIPAQSDLVVAHGVRSVFGFGGLLPAGELEGAAHS